MKNIFDAVKGANLGNIGSNLSSVLGGNAAAGAKNVASSMGGVGGLVGSAAIGGLMGALFSGKKAKKMAKGALVVGGTAAAGALAWNFYQKWSQSNNAPQQTQTPTQGAYTAQQSEQTQSQALPQAESTAIILLEAMVFAARADGHIDEEEKQNIHNATEALFPGQQISGLLDNLLQKPIDPVSLAAKVQNKEEAYDLYRLSCAAIDIDSFMERSYLDGLAKALNLNEAEKSNLEQEAMAARQQA